MLRRSKLATQVVYCSARESCGASTSAASSHSASGKRFCGWVHRRGSRWAEPGGGGPTRTLGPHVSLGPRQPCSVDRDSPCPSVASEPDETTLEARSEPRQRLTGLVTRRASAHRVLASMLAEAAVVPVPGEGETTFEPLSVAGASETGAEVLSSNPIGTPIGALNDHRASSSPCKLQRT